MMMFLNMFLRSEPGSPPNQRNPAAFAPFVLPARSHIQGTIMRLFITGAWQPLAASTASLHVDASVPLPSYHWPRQQRYFKQPASTSTGVRRLSYSTLALEPSQASPILAAVTAGRRRYRGVVTSSNISFKSSPTRGRGLGASPASAASEHGRTDKDNGDLAALLDMLGLTERDILPNMSQRNQALLGLGQERGGLAGRGGKAAHDG